MSDKYSIQFKIIKDFDLIVEKHIGLIQLGFLIESMETLSSKKEYSNEANYLIDLRLSKFSMDIDKVKEFVTYLERNFSKAIKNKIALIADESDQVAMATLFKMLQSGISRNIHVFSTLEYAALWLNIDMDENDFEKLISETSSILEI